MTSYTFPQIHRRPDGSIDTDAYIARAHALRGAAARDLAGRLTRGTEPRAGRDSAPRRGLLARLAWRMGRV